MISYPRTRGNSKYYAFHNDYGHLTLDCKKLRGRLKPLLTEATEVNHGIREYLE